MALPLRQVEKPQSLPKNLASSLLTRILDAEATFHQITNKANLGIYQLFRTMSIQQME
jgi:hypothetical protein